MVSGAVASLRSGRRASRQPINGGCPLPAYFPLAGETSGTRGGTNHRRRTPKGGPELSLLSVRLKGTYVWELARAGLGGVPPTLFLTRRAHELSGAVREVPL